MSQENQESKVEIVNNVNNGEEDLALRIANLLDKLDIDIEKTEISLENCIKIIGEINKGIAETKAISSTLINISADDKAEKIYNIVINLLNNPIVSKKLSKEVQTQIKGYVSNKELVSAIGDLVNWVSDTVLTSYDNNNDGIVTVEEISEDVVNCCLCKTDTSEGCACYRSGGCCSCCQKCSRFLGVCWGKFFTNILCCGCGSNKINIK